ncbi:MAG: hypothetical protein OHK0029_28400 [Armatimonadaceae bacterium]
MMNLKEFVSSVSGFISMSQTEQVKLFGWFILSYGGYDRFTTTQVRHCFENLHMDVPNITDVLNKLESRKRKVVLKDGRGWRLEMRVRQEMDTKYGNRPISIAVEKSLIELPNSLVEETKRKYLEEALKCYKVGAFRAAIIMTWNLAYDHLLNWILADPMRIAKFNTKLPNKPPFFFRNPFWRNWKGYCPA